MLTMLGVDHKLLSSKLELPLFFDQSLRARLLLPPRWRACVLSFCLLLTRASAGLLSCLRISHKLLRWLWLTINGTTVLDLLQILVFIQYWAPLLILLLFSLSTFLLLKGSTHLSFKIQIILFHQSLRQVFLVGFDLKSLTHKLLFPNRVLLLGLWVIILFLFWMLH